WTGSPMPSMPNRGDLRPRSATKRRYGGRGLSLRSVNSMQAVKRLGVSRARGETISLDSGSEQIITLAKCNAGATFVVQSMYAKKRQGVCAAYLTGVH